MRQDEEIKKLRKAIKLARRKKDLSAAYILTRRLLIMAGLLKEK